MAYRHVSRESWPSRLLGSIRSVGVGFLLALGALPLMWCNEGRAVRTARSLEEGRGAVVPVASDSVDPANDGRLVHLSGRAETSERLVDPEFGVAAVGIQLVRTVEMYQWREREQTETKVRPASGNETVRTYTYTAVWSEDRIDSSSFHGATSPRNPGPLPFASKTFYADDVTLGAFRLPRGLVAQMEGREPLRLSEAPPPASGLRLDGDGLYRGKDPARPEIGDVRVRYSVVRPQVVSVVAGQSGRSFDSYQTRAGNGLLMLSPGSQGPDAMFRAAETANRVLTWILRVVGVFLLFVGVMLVFRPVAVLGSVVPIFGTLLGAGLFVFSLGIALSVSLATMAVAWIFYRPLLGLALLGATAIALVLLARAARRRGAPSAP